MSRLIYRIDATNGHVNRISRLPALVQSFLGIFLCVFCCCLRGYRYQWHSFFFYLSFFMRLLILIQDET